MSAHSVSIHWTYATNVFANPAGTSRSSLAEEAVELQLFDATNTDIDVCLISTVLQTFTTRIAIGSTTSVVCTPEMLEQFLFHPLAVCRSSFEDANHHQVELTVRTACGHTNLLVGLQSPSSVERMCNANVEEFGRWVTALTRWWLSLLMRGSMLSSAAHRQTSRDTPGSNSLHLARTGGGDRLLDTIWLLDTILDAEGAATTTAI